MYLVVPLSLSLFLSSVYVTWQAWTAYASTSLEKTYPRLTQDLLKLAMKTSEITLLF